MLTQLSRLSIKAEGRYAQASELQFLKKYLQSIPLRISAYEKIREVEKELIDKVVAKIEATEPQLFRSDREDYTEICRRDMTQVLKCAAAALLFNDGDRLQEGLLLWDKTIVKAIQREQTCNKAYGIMQEVIKDYLTSEEVALFSSLLVLSQITLG